MATESTPMDNPDLVLRQAETCRDLQQWSEADRLFSLVASADFRPATQMSCGIYFAERQNYHAAIVHLMRSLDGAQSLGDLDLQAAILGQLASLYRELGDYDLAQRFQRQVLAIHNDVTASELLDWSSDALLAGNLRLADKLVCNALSLAEDSVDIRQQADAWGLRGIIAARQANPRMAVRLLIRAARGHHIIGDDRGLGFDFQNLAEVFGLMDRFAWQQFSFKAAETCFVRAGMPVSTQRVAHRLREEERLATYRNLDPLQN